MFSLAIEFIKSAKCEKKSTTKKKNGTQISNLEKSESFFKKKMSRKGVLNISMIMKQRSISTSNVSLLLRLRWHEHAYFAKSVFNKLKCTCCFTQNLKDIFYIIRKDWPRDKIAVQRFQYGQAIHVQITTNNETHEKR